ncbi:MAG: hypothetical protein OEV40_29085 [Acidimicrobiia bacterium]|nr:hypothetical protein [Acidimicrobiia bacterium]
MSRLERLRRVAAAVETRERHARRAMAAANRDRDEAIIAVRAVLDQCRDASGAAAPTRDRPRLPLAAAHALIQSGLREATDRERLRDEAGRTAEEKQMLWQDAHRRNEAISRLTDRWQLAERTEVDRRRYAALDDLITARAHGPRAGARTASVKEEQR